MPLSVLVVLVVVGLAIVIGSVHLSGGTEQHSLDRAAVHEGFRNDFPEVWFDEIILSDDGQAALLFGAADDCAGFAFAMGSHFVTRLLDEHSLRSVEARENGAELRFVDTTRSHQLFLVKDAAQRGLIVGRLQSILT